MTERERDALLVIGWLVGLQDEKPRDAGEQWPLAWQAARAYLAQYSEANDNER